MGVNLKDNTYLCRSQLKTREALGLDQEELYWGRLLFLFFLRAGSEREGEKHQHKVAHPAIESRHILSTYFYGGQRYELPPAYTGGRATSKEEENEPVLVGIVTSTTSRRDQYW